MTNKAESMKGLKKSHYCGHLNQKNIGEEVTLMGWVNRRRDHGGLIFVDLRDITGVIQTVFDPKVIGEAFAKVESIRSEYVLAIKGEVIERPTGTINTNLPTGHIEINATEVKILNTSETPPFYIEEDLNVDENVRLKYRYLDLRRPDMQRVFILRNKVNKALRDFLHEKSFIEIETPMLTRSTPEGARDYLVPSRVHPGEFYALPQSPQIFKQLLMVSGMDRYFQMARCFRDEDLRADRQPEFTQLDMEMSFIDEEDIYSLIEDMMAFVIKESIGFEIHTPFKRLKYDEAIERFGSDKPDLRFGMELRDISDIAEKCSFKVFKDVVEKGGVVKAINAKSCSFYSRKDIDELTDYVSNYGAKGLAWMIIEEKTIKSPIAKFFDEQELEKIKLKLDAKTGDLLLFVADMSDITADALGNLRLEIARRENLLDKNELKFVWVTHFPLFEYDDEEKRYVSIHHPFTSPCEEDLELMKDNTVAVKAKAYDLAVNGVELGGGSIRIHSRKVQEEVFGLLGLSNEEINNKFGFMLKAFEYGTPPHGGIAFGLDRMIMILAGRSSIRDVIAFPKTQSASDLLTEAPSSVDNAQLKELNIKIIIPEEKK